MVIIVVHYPSSIIYHSSIIYLMVSHQTLFLYLSTGIYDFWLLWVSMVVVGGGSSSDWLAAVFYLQLPVLIATFYAFDRANTLSSIHNSKQFFFTFYIEPVGVQLISSDLQSFHLF
jgi:hypothetical protein